ncbi:acyl-CoA N-acyltransferase [Earliella scabrosa]|nr:acyl-CoA N-acyltransferase [Earliella scabrosa]
MEDSRSFASASPSVFPLPNPPAPSDMQAYRDFRLAALQTDPSYFSSTYEREVAFPDETWRERLTGSGKATIVAQASQPDWARDERGTDRLVGCMTVIAARNFGASQLPRGARVEDTYFVFGMWVRPEHRRRGVGGMLLERGLRWIAEDGRESGDGENKRDQESWEAWLAVTPSNVAARGMYKAGGFEELADQPEDNIHGEIWMKRRLVMP